METANEGRFSSQNVMQWNEVDGPIKFTHLIYYLFIIIFIPTLTDYRGTLLAHPLQSIIFKRRKKKIRQSWHWQVPFLFSLARHGRVRRGRE